jgi:carbon-monoxide dehydrogenase large subunit
LYYDLPMAISLSATTEAPVAGGRYVGRSIERPEDGPLVVGEATFVGDVFREGQLHLRLVRSTIAHGRIVEIDLAAAAAHPGVVAVISATDLPDVRVPLRMELGDLDSQRRALQPPLATDRVRYVGEPVAAVVARDLPTAEDAAQLVSIDVEELDPVLSTERGTAGDAPVLHEALGGNVADRFRWRLGDVDALFASADVVVRDVLSTQRHSGIPMETRGLVAEYDGATGRLTIWGAAKVKHFNRAALAAMLGMPEEAINLVECEVGGGFGVRGELYPEDYLVAHLARELRKPIRWIEDRAEHLVATNHSREQDHVLEVAATADGRLLAFRDRARSDMGAYMRTHGAIVPISTSTQMPGPYAWGAFEIQHEVVLTNKTPTGTYRGPGGTEASFARERLLDQVAHQLGISALELRRRNLIRRDQFPFVITYDEGHGGFTHDTGNYVALWDEMLERADVDALADDVERRRLGGELVGIGTAAFAEVAVIGPWEQARVTPMEDGRIRVALGVSSVGQGVRTALGQLAADLLGVSFEDVVIDYESTDTTPFGFGAFASRVTTVGGNAVAAAIANLHERARDMTAIRLGVDPSSVDVDGHVVRGPDGDEVTLLELGCVGEGKFVKEDMSVGFGATLAVVSVDPETGVPTVERLVVATDVGTPINPMLVRGQLVGAAAQGVGGALLERFAYDDNGQPLSTTFADYLIPTATDVPAIEVVTAEVRVPNNPLGLGPAGENGIYGVAPAIANAAAAAIGEGSGVCTALPLTPEKLWRAIGRIGSETSVTNSQAHSAAW